MKEYEKRLRTLESGLQGISGELAVPAKADAGFFIAMSADFLKGERLTDKEAARLERHIGAIDNPILKDGFNGSLKDNTVNTARDAALFLAASSGIITVPINGKDDDNMQVRWSVGQADTSEINEALYRLSTRIGGDTAAKGNIYGW